MKKKAQAAMEFLMTYGWAILVVLVVIGALAYFGVLSPKKLLPDKCLFGPGIGVCKDYQLTTSGVTLVLTNGFGEKITITDISVKTAGSPTELCALNTQTIAILPGASNLATEIAVTGCTLTEGDKVNLE